MRHVLVVSPNLTELQRGKVYSEEELGGMDVDKFIAKGLGIEHDVDDDETADAAEIAPDAEAAQARPSRRRTRAAEQTELETDEGDADGEGGDQPAGS